MSVPNRESVAEAFPVWFCKAHGALQMTAGVCRYKRQRGTPCCEVAGRFIPLVDLEDALVIRRDDFSKLNWAEAEQLLKGYRFNRDVSDEELVTRLVDVALSDRSDK